MMDLQPSRTIQLSGGPADGQEFLVLLPTADTYYFLNGQLLSDKVSGSSVYRKQESKFVYQS